MLASLFMSCPAGTGIQISLYASPHILPSLKEQANMLPVDEIASGDEESNRNRNILPGSRTPPYRSLPERGPASRSLRITSICCGLPLRDCHHDALIRKSPADVEEAIRIKESTHAT